MENNLQLPTNQNDHKKIILIVIGLLGILIIPPIATYDGFCWGFLGTGCSFWEYVPNFYFQLLFITFPLLMFASPLLLIILIIVIFKRRRASKNSAPNS